MQLKLLDKNSAQNMNTHTKTWTFSYSLNNSKRNNGHRGTDLSISVRMTGRLAAMFVFVPNFLPNGRSQTTASTLALGRGSTAHTHTEENRQAKR